MTGVNYMTELLIVIAAGALFFAFKNRQRVAAGLGNLGMAKPKGSNLNYYMAGGGLCLLLAAALVWWFWDEIKEPDFATMLAVALVILIFGHLLRTSKTDDLKKALPYYLGVAAIAAVLWFNGAGSFAKSGLNAANAYAEKAAATGGLFEGGCPGTQQIKEYGDTFTLHKGCDEQLIKVPMTIDPWYVIGDSRFPGEFKRWGHSKWHPVSGNLVVIDTIRWPEGIDDDTVEVTVVSAEQAAEMMKK